MADTRPQPSAEPVAIFQAARRAWLAGPTIVRDPETHSVRIGDKEAAAAVIASALEAARLEALEQAAKVIETAGLDPNVSNHLDARMCCTGHMCGCQGSTVAEYLAYQLRALKENPNAG